MPDLPYFDDRDYYAEWSEQLEERGLHQIRAILYLAKEISDSAEKMSAEASDAAGGPSHRFGVYRIPEHHMIRLGAMLHSGTTE